MTLLPRTELVFGSSVINELTISSSLYHLYILLDVDYVSKWVEAIACLRNDASTVVNFMQKHIFSRFGMLDELKSHLFLVHFSVLFSVIIE